MSVPELFDLSGAISSAIKWWFCFAVARNDPELHWQWYLKLCGMNPLRPVEPSQSPRVRDSTELFHTVPGRDDLLKAVNHVETPRNETNGQDRREPSGIKQRRQGREQATGNKRGNRERKATGGKKRNDRAGRGNGRNLEQVVVAAST